MPPVMLSLLGLFISMMLFGLTVPLKPGYEKGKVDWHLDMEDNIYIFIWPIGIPVYIYRLITAERKGDKHR